MGPTAERRVMEKICIVRRRVVPNDFTIPPEVQQPREVIYSHDAQSLSIALTPAQAEILRNNNYFQDLCDGRQDQIFFSFHFGADLTPNMVTPKDVCEMLKVSPGTLSRLVKAGAIKSYQIGRLRRFSVDDLLEYLSGSPKTDKARRLRAEIIVMPRTENQARLG